MHLNVEAHDPEQGMDVFLQGAIFSVGALPLHEEHMAPRPEYQAVGPANVARDCKFEILVLNSTRSAPSGELFLRRCLYLALSALRHRILLSSRIGDSSSNARPDWVGIRWPRELPRSERSDLLALWRREPHRIDVSRHG